MDDILIFQENKFNEKMKHENKRSIMILHNVICHTPNSRLLHVKFVFLPAKT